MKILRRKKGYTTNSSGTNEWIAAKGVANSNSPDVPRENARAPFSLLVLIVASILLFDHLVRWFYARKRDSE